MKNTFIKCMLAVITVASLSMYSHDNALASNVNSSDSTASTSTTATDTTKTETLSEKAGFNVVKVSESGAVTLSVSENGYAYNDDLSYGDYDDDYDYYDDEYSYTSYSPKKCELYRSDKEDGLYTSLGLTDLDKSSYNADCIDSTTVLGNTYYYKVRYVDDSSKTIAYGEFSSPLKVTAVPTPKAIKNVRATAAKTFTIKWSAVSNIDGYNIYMKEFDNDDLSGLHYYSTWETDGLSSSNYVPESVANIEFTYVGTVSASATSTKYKKASHGKGYIFAIRSYKLVGGEKVESTTYYAAHGVMDYYFCYNAENPKYDYKWPKNEKQARKLCKTISVKVWDFKNHAKHSGAKYTRTQWITVNKKYAATIKQIYKELYKDKSKPPIYEAGSYRWRPDESTWSYHTVGTAIDMNCNENPMYKFEYKKNGKVKKKIIVGSFYKPKSNPYSFPRNGVVEKTFAKYGFVRLNNDLMHFNADYISPSSNYDYKFSSNYY